MIVRALVADLMDRSRISAALGSVEYVRVPADLAGADLVLVDLQRVAIGQLPTGMRIVGFASHVDRATIVAAKAAGIEAMARSEFFRRLPGLPSGPTTRPIEPDVGE